MSTYILIDSEYKENPDESVFDFYITPTQTINWPIQPRTVNAVQGPVPHQPLDFLSAVEIKDLFIHYNDTVQAVLPEPLVKVVFFNLEHNDRSLNTMDDEVDVKFVLRNQKEFTPDVNNNRWVRYSSNMTQVMRMKRQGSFLFKVLDKDNNVLDAGDSARAICVVSIIPYHLEGGFADTHQIQARA